MTTRIMKIRKLLAVNQVGDPLRVLVEMNTASRSIVILLVIACLWEALETAKMRGTCTGQTCQNGTKRGSYFVLCLDDS
jgi:hypothetical protein